MHPAIVSGIVTRDALVSYWPFFPVPSNSPRSLCGKGNTAQFSCFLSGELRRVWGEEWKRDMTGGGRKKGRGRRIPLNTQAKEFKTMILLLKTVNLQASWRADCAVNVNILFCLAINSGPARDQMKYSRWKEIFCESLWIPDESYMPLLGDNTVSIPKQFLLLLKTLLFYGCWGRGRGGARAGESGPPDSPPSGALPLSPIIFFFFNPVIRQALKSCEL